MTDAKFDEIWNNILKQILEHRLHNNKQLYTPVSIEDLHKKVKLRYNSLRDGIKRDFMRNVTGLIDRHKICACMYKAMVDVQLIKVYNGLLEQEFIFNANMAFLSSCAILNSFILDDAKKLADANYESFIRKQIIPCFPELKDSTLIDSYDSYLTQTIKTLYYEQISNNLSILELANIFRLLEQYTDSIYKAMQPKIS